MRNYNYNVSSLFGTNDNSSLLGEFAAKKTGSYRRLLKTYYSDLKKWEQEDTKNKNEISAIKDKLQLPSAKPGYAQMKKEADGLKSASQALQKDELWAQKDGVYDTEKITSAVQNFVKEYNEVLDQEAKVNSKDISQTAKYMTNLTNTLSKALSKVGIETGKDGKLSLNKDTFKTADMKSVKSLFAGAASYGASVGEKASDIARSTVTDSGLYVNSGYLKNSFGDMFNTWI